MERHIVRLQKKKIPSQIPIKAVSRAMGFILHAALLFCLLHKAQLYHTVIKEIALFVPSLFSAVSLCPPSWPGKKYFFLPRMNCETYWLLKHAFLSQLGSPGYKIVAQAVNLLWYCLISHDGLIVRNSDQLERTSSATQHLSLWMPSCAPGSHFSFKINSVSRSCRLQRKSFKCEWRINQCCAEKSLKKQF